MMETETGELPEEFQTFANFYTLPDSFEADDSMSKHSSSCHENDCSDDSNKEHDLRSESHTNSNSGSVASEPISKIIPNVIAQLPEMPMNSERSWDNFRVRRDCFRAFSAYYKDQFKPFNKVWQSGKRNKLKKTDMVPLVMEFLRNEFENQEIDSLVIPMMTILHSHRYKKQEEFLDGLDFTIIRGLV